MDPDALAERWSALGLAPGPGAAEVAVEVVGADPVLATGHRIGEGAAAAVAFVGREAAALHHRRGGPTQAVGVDVAAAATSLIGFVVQQAEGIDLTRVRNATIAPYATADDRWVHLHGGFPHLAAGLLDLLGLPSGAEDDPEAIGAAVAAWDAQHLEDAIAEAGLCGAMVRSPEEWAAHPQGAHLAGLPVVTVERLDDAPARPLPTVTGDRPRPLDGVRVVDQTRVLAGPTCGRTLASLGAQVLRVGAARLPSVEPFVVDTGPGKRNAFLDLAEGEDRASFDALVAGADVVTQGYRPGALDRLGVSPAHLAEASPGVVVVQISCYGATGPWGERPGWEQLAQSASGMAWLDGAMGEGGAPRLTPAAATDYTTGYLAAAGALVALGRRSVEGGSWLVRASLAQTAGWLLGAGPRAEASEAVGVGELGERQLTTDTAWGRLTHLAPVLDLPATPCRWDRPPEPLGASPPAWW